MRAVQLMGVDHELWLYMSMIFIVSKSFEIEM